MLKVEFQRDVGGHEKPMQQMAFTRDLDDLPHFLLDSSRPEVEEVSDDFLPFLLKYTVDTRGYALVPKSGAPMLDQSIAIRASQLPV